MADEDTQAQPESWWTPDDALSGAALPSPTFDEPLEWPEALAWDQPAAGAEAPETVPAVAGSDDLGDLGDLDLADLGGDLFPPAAEPAAFVEADPVPDLQLPIESATAEPASAGPAADDPAPEGLEPLSESVWAGEAASSDDELVAAPTLAVPSVYAEHEPRRGAAGWLPRSLDLRQSKATVVALSTFVGLVLLGTFLSVRAPDDGATDSSQPRRPTGDIAAQGRVDPLPSPTTTATTTPPDPIVLTDLLPADEGAEPTAGETSGGAAAGSSTGGAGPRTGSASTPPPARSAAPTGGGGGRSAQPAASQPASGRSTPRPEPEPAPKPTSSTGDSSSAGDTPRTRRPTMSIPTFTEPTSPTTTPTTTPSRPEPPPFPEFPGND